MDLNLESIKTSSSERGGSVAPDTKFRLASFHILLCQVFEKKFKGKPPFFQLQKNLDMIRRALGGLVAKWQRQVTGRWIASNPRVVHISALSIRDCNENNIYHPSLPPLVLNTVTPCRILGGMSIASYWLVYCKDPLSVLDKVVYQNPGLVETCQKIIDENEYLVSGVSNSLSILYFNYYQRRIQTDILQCSLRSKRIEFRYWRMKSSRSAANWYSINFLGTTTKNFILYNAGRKDCEYPSDLIDIINLNLKSIVYWFVGDYQEKATSAS